MARETFRISVALCALMAFVACSEKHQLAHKGQTDPSPAPTAAAGKSDDAAAAVGAPVKKKKKTGTGADDETLPDEVEKPEEKGETIEQILDQCGVADLNDKQKTIYSKTMQSAIVNSGDQLGQKYIVYLTATLNVESNLTRSLAISSFEVTKVDAALLAQLIIKGQAEKRVAKFAGTQTMEMIPFEKRTEALDKVEDWTNIYCTITAAKRLTSTFGGFQTVVEFTPAFPSAVSPKADSNRYVTEIGKSRSFKNIEAKVVSTTNPALTAGQIIKGEFAVEQITASRQAPGGKTLKGDIAYKMTATFGTPVQLQALGLKPSTEYYIDHKLKSLTGVVIDSGDPDAGGPTFFSDR